MCLSLFSADKVNIEFVKLKGAKRNNRETGYWEIGWGVRQSDVGNTGQQVVSIGPFRYERAGQRQEIGEMYVRFSEKDIYTIAINTISNVKDIYKVEIEDAQQGEVIAESAVIIKGEGIYTSPLFIEKPSNDIKLKFFFSGDTTLENVTLYIYKSFFNLYPVKDTYPLLGIYYKKFGEYTNFSDIFEDRLVEGKVQELNNTWKEGIPVSYIHADYFRLLYTKLGKEFGIEVPLIGEEDIWLVQRIYGGYNRLLFSDTGEYKSRGIGKDSTWSVISELLSSAIFDTDRDGRWKGFRPYDWISGDRLLDNYGKEFYLDYVLFIPATFFDVDKEEITAGKLSFIYLTRDNKEKEVSLPLAVDNIPGGKLRICFINTGGNIQIIQKRGDKNKILSIISDSLNRWCLPVKPESIRIE
ncbi:MAG: hypothetical protein NC905_04875 [Candidatus Omnitrophica bacterium]|nr:hypothetical protein [Candidatus Omnitrophota bacterium]